MKKQVYRWKCRANRGVGEREKQADKQLGSLSGAGGKGVSKHNVRPSTVWAPKLVRAKNIENLGF